jgi:hypothetical protein
MVLHQSRSSESLPNVGSSGSLPRLVPSKSIPKNLSEAHSSGTAANAGPQSGSAAANTTVGNEDGSKPAEETASFSGDDTTFYDG